MKKLYIITALILLVFVLISAATPKPGPSVKLTLINKMETQDGYIFLNGLTNFYQYYLVAKSYASEKTGTGETMKRLPDHPKSNIVTYELRKDVYEISIISCGSMNSGLMELMRNTEIVFPLCERDMYGKQFYVEPRSVCLRDPANPVCKKQGYIFTSKGNKGEASKVKVRKPPSVDSFTDD